MSDITSRNRRRFLVLGLGAMAISGFAPVDALARATDAKNLIEKFHQDLLPLLSGSGGNLSPAALSNTVGDNFHMRLIARVVSGKAWKEMDSTTRQRLADTILKMNVATYVSQLGDVQLTSYQIDGVRDGQQQTKLVDATLRSADDEILLTYVTREIEGRWWIIDVLVERKFSELSMRQAEYQGLIRASGVDGLIATLETKAAELSSN